tara:strand:- start:487 stop:771 length:285 start_codon:yes stop_codon:yes gene_type:complete
MNAMHHSVDIIVTDIYGYVSLNEVDYTSWKIGKQAPMLIAALSKRNGIKVIDCWSCKYDDADKIVKHFVAKGMVQDDSPLAKNAAQGVYIYQVN